MLADILIALAAIGFLGADIRQAWKLWRYKNYSTKAISRTHWKVKIISLITVISGYMLLNLNFAIIVAMCQLGLSIYVMTRVGWRN